MTYRPRSLKHEFELYVEREIEDYKNSVSRSALLRLGDQAVRVLAAQQQLALTELLLCEEVDRLIRSRIELPAFSDWCKRRQNSLKEFRRPERWNIVQNGALTRAVGSAPDGHVLVAGAEGEGTTLYLAANGCAVTTLDSTGDIVERVLNAAFRVGLTGRVRGIVADVASWAPDMPLNAVVCMAAAFAGLSPAECMRAIMLLQNATTAGGVHLLETGDRDRCLLTMKEIAARYGGWQVSIEHDAQRSEILLARKEVS